MSYLYASTISVKRGDHPRSCGKDRMSTSGTGRGRDHPRSCGKDQEMTFTLLEGLGSPPLMRERPAAVRWPGRRPGITPARAGKTIRKAHRSRGCWDHPRSCGKDTISEGYHFRHKGSPPLVRERLIQTVSSIIDYRITPARAGKTTVRTSSAIKLRDHPRSCGKDTLIYPARKRRLGSPPLVRERHEQKAAEISKVGSPPLVRERRS